MNAARFVVGHRSGSCGVTNEAEFYPGGGCFGRSESDPPAGVKLSHPCWERDTDDSSKTCDAEDVDYAHLAVPSSLVP